MLCKCEQSGSVLQMTSQSAWVPPPYPPYNSLSPYVTSQITHNHDDISPPTLHGLNLLMTTAS